MSKKSTVKLYCFIYEIEDNQMYRQDDNAEIYKDDYFYHDDEYDESIYVQGWKIDNPQYNNDTDKPFIYMYSLNDDVNHAMELMHKSLEETVEEARKKLAYCEKILETFKEKQEYIKNKYPSKKEQESG